MKTLSELRLVPVAGTKKAYINFEDYSDAEEFAVANGGTLVLLRHRLGESVWTIKDYSPSHGIRVTANDYGPEYAIYSDLDEVIECEIEPLCEILCELRCMDDIESIPETMRGIASKIEDVADITSKMNDLLPDERIVVLDGRYYDTICCESAYWENDGTIWALGVIDVEL